MGGRPHQPLLPAQPVPQGTAVLGRGEEPASYLFAPAFHRVKQPDFAANPGGGLASGTGDEDAANTFGDAPGTGPNPSPKRRSGRAAPACPQVMGDSGWGPRHWLGTSLGPLRGCPGSSLRAEASTSWPSPERQTGCGDRRGGTGGGTGLGAVLSPRGLRQEPHRPTDLFLLLLLFFFVADGLISFSPAANSSSLPSFELVICLYCS